MQVSKNTIIEKMAKELETAKHAKTIQETTASMGHIKLLSELWLDEYNKYSKNDDFSDGISIVPSATSHELQQADLSQDQKQILESAEKKIRQEKDDFSIFDF